MYEAIIAILIGLDQVIKHWALNSLKDMETVPVIKNIFNLTYVENRGAAFGLFENNQMIFVVVALIASIAGLYMLHSKKINSKICKFSIVLIIAGALGNLIDRVRLDFVVDYFDFVFISNSLMKVMKVSQINKIVYPVSNEIFNKIIHYCGT